MNFKIQLVVDDDQGQIKTEDIIQFERDDNSIVGLSLIESKSLLKALQRSIVLYQGFWLDRKSWIITLQDITERKHKESELEVAARVFSSSSEGIIITDIDGRMIDVNTGFEHTFGYKGF
ncbi:TPA: PAS domain S-box protein [Legionella pneumophila]|nr:PAS domain S-box protein [Legionella pneumophila]MCK1859624.1 PAS domain S-box protein [Legionella pneumophila]HDV5711117.1 PAS domain S-box protein [Legionella pneumophila]HDV5714047.1 PAS domain S-box protein [Legionella pneumophila]HDV5806986.1 PAS domain S-box protein [Legionella pneumophila]HDV5941062.1 PAS domain S-box protein [Legionella pneumophila]